MVKFNVTTDNTTTEALLEIKYTPLSNSDKESRLLGQFLKRALDTENYKILVEDEPIFSEDGYSTQVHKVTIKVQPLIP